VTAVFITGTGPAVGKTFVAAALIKHFRSMEREVDAIKPVVTGYDSVNAANSDPGVLLSAVGLPPTPVGIERISPWRFRAALSPDRAAYHEGRRIDVDRVIAFCQSAVEQRRGILLVEGVGGIMAPLDERRTILDVMMALRLPLVLVAGSYPGSVSHTLTALDSLFRRDMNVLAIVVSETPGSPVPIDETVAAASRFAEAVIALPRSRHQGGETATVAAFGRLFSRQGGGASQ
jgi:dethiobiotin synthetase